MKIAAFIFDGITTLDVVGPLQVLSRVPGVTIKMVGKKAGPVTDRDIPLQLVADSSINDVTEADILLVPGGLGTRGLVKDEAVLDWIRHIDKGSKWTTSVCTGSLLLAASGIINGLKSTTHWAAADMLNSLGATYTSERVVEQGKYIMAAGVLGRLFADASENAANHERACLRLAGASPIQCFLYVTLPSIIPQLLSYTLYRWENNIRAASVLGVVGAGGLGQMLSYHMGLVGTNRRAI
ncbi:MAG: hypothetical protein EBT41_12015 [Betaproteobacteria bacterium]|nr:hypothetical protein [Betaproteobacteria bacterium]